MNILAIDPGPDKSAWIIYDTKNKKPLRFGIDDNLRLLQAIKISAEDCIAIFNGYDYDIESPELCIIEMISSYGMPVGKEVFETCVWIGRFEIAFGLENCRRLYRYEVKSHLCNSVKAKDSNIKQALIDKFGNSKQEVIGTKKKPGILYGIKKDVWSALAVAVTFAETRN